MIFKNNYIENKINDLVNKNYWGLAVGFARASLALALLLTLVFNSNDVLFSFGLENELTPQLNKTNILSIYNLFEDLALAKYLSIFILMLTIIGIYPRFTCIFHWWVTYSFFTTSFAVDGGDQINNILTLFLIPICLLDNRKSHWQKVKVNHNYYAKVILFFSFLLIRIQVAFLYFQAATGKFAVDEWVNGTAIYYWFTSNTIGMNESLYPIIMPFLSNPFTVTFITWGVLIFELFLFSCFFIKNKKIKKTAWFLGVFFHLGIIIVHGLVSFFFSMLGALTLYLIYKK